MIVLNRNLKLKSDGGDVVVPINVCLPVDEEDCWTCEYEIGWPAGVRKSHAFGIDSVQSILLTMEKKVASSFTRVMPTSQESWFGWSRETDMGFHFPQMFGTFTKAGTDRCDRLQRRW
jgi:hypothetical protein